jgi:RND family efflux transporter MFP subunit
MKKLLFLVPFALFGEDIYATFDVVPNREAGVSIAVSGLVKKVYTDVGHNVKKGQLILELDNTDLQKSIEMSLADLEVMKENLRYSKLQLERYTKVKDVISKDEFDRFEYDKNLKEKSIKQVEASIEYKKSIIKKSYIYAPFSGVVTAKMIESGDVINPGQKAFTIVDNNVRMIVNFDQKYWKDITSRCIFEYKVDGSDVVKTTKLGRIYPTIDNKTRKAKAEIVTSGLRIGLFGDGNIKCK